VDDALVLVDPAMLAWQIIGSELRPVFSHENLYLSSMHEGIFGADGTGTALGATSFPALPLD
jgi:hypothetical protein